MLPVIKMFDIFGRKFIERKRYGLHFTLEDKVIKQGIRKWDSHKFIDLNEDQHL
eukprot:SAG31_NODE_932_length_10913_cov_3.933235_6_plen_54_part_00